MATVLCHLSALCLVPLTDHSLEPFLVLQPAQEVSQVIGQNEKLEPNLIGIKPVAGEPGSVQGILAFLNPLLRRPTASIITFLKYVIMVTIVPLSRGQARRIINLPTPLKVTPRAVEKIVAGRNKELRQGMVEETAEHD